MTEPDAYERLVDAFEAACDEAAGIERGYYTREQASEIRANYDDIRAALLARLRAKDTNG